MADDRLAASNPLLGKSVVFGDDLRLGDRFILEEQANGSLLTRLVEKWCADPDEVQVFELVVDRDGQTGFKGCYQGRSATFQPFKAECD